MNPSITTHVSGLKPSATLAINEHCNTLIQEGKKVIKLGFGQSPFPVPQAVVESLKQHAHEKDYLPVKGLYALREAVAQYYQQKLQLDCFAEDVLIGPGSKELLFLIQLIYEGELLLPQPSWVSYAPQAQLAHKKHHWLPTFNEDNYLLNAKTLRAHCEKQPEQQRILILNYPSNPTGATFDEQAARAIAEVAREFNILILSDEIYGDVHHSGQHISIAQYYPEGTIISSGLSKWCGAGGWRLGTFLFPKKLRWLLSHMAVVASETFTSTSAPIQYAAIQAFQGSPAIDKYVAKSRMILARVAQGAYNILQQSQITCPPPAGGFYLMPIFDYYRDSLEGKGISSSVQLCQQLLQDTGVSLLPLSDFGFPESFLGARLSYVDFDGTQALAMIEDQPDATAEVLAPRVIAGVQLIADWLS